MHELTQLIKKDMLPALGVTEPGAIAFCVAKARSFAKGELVHVNVAMNSGMYKNAFTCGIPNSNEVGNVFSAALGYVAGNADKGLEALADVKPGDNVTAQKLIDEGKVTVELSGITSRIFIEAQLETTESKVVVTIRDAHTNITKIVVNGETVLETEDEHAADTTEADAKAEVHTIHNYTLAQIVDYVKTVPLEEIEFVKDAYKVNLELFEEGLNNPRTTFARQLLAMNGGEIISKDEKMTGSLLCNAAIEARVIGLDKPAMSITGSGAHGIIATMPLYGYYKIHGLSEECLYRATMLSYLVCTFIKEYSGRLSAFCGCTMKGVAACDAAFKSVEFAMNGVHIDKVHGINGATPEDTMRNMGLIASPGMIGTEKTIVEIFEDKLK